MSISTTTITFALTLPSGLPVAGGKATFTLTGFDLDGGIIMPAAVDAAIAEDGTGSVALWPNVAGLKSTNYKVSITPTTGTRVEGISVSVPESPTPVQLHTLVQTGSIAGLNAVILTQEEYDALDSRNSQTLYLIRAEG